MCLKHHSPVTVDKRPYMKEMWTDTSVSHFSSCKTAGGCWRLNVAHKLCKASVECTTLRQIIMINKQTVKHNNKKEKAEGYFTTRTSVGLT